MPIIDNNIERMVVGAFVYHKYCKSRSHLCTNIAARSMTIN